MSLTEADVCRAHAGLVRTIAAQAGGIDREEAQSLVELGLLKAIRTWRSCMGDFEGYAAQRMRQELDLFKRCVNRQRSAESVLSLDTKLCDACDATFEAVLAIAEADWSVIDVGLFIRALPPRTRMFVRLRMRGYSNMEIAVLMKMLAPDVDAIHKAVMRQAKDYFQLEGVSCR